MKRSDFVQNTGHSEQFFAQMQLLKILSYDPPSIPLTSGQPLGTGGFIQSFAAQQADTSNITPTSTYSADLQAGLASVAANLSNWERVTHTLQASFAAWGRHVHAADGIGCSTQETSSRNRPAFA